VVVCKVVWITGDWVYPLGTVYPRRFPLAAQAPEFGPIMITPFVVGCDITWETSACLVPAIVCQSPDTDMGDGIREDLGFDKVLLVTIRQDHRSCFQCFHMPNPCMAKCVPKVLAVYVHFSDKLQQWEDDDGGNDGLTTKSQDER
jgi:hypothetical protein